MGQANDGRSRRERRLGCGGVSPGPRSPASNRNRESKGLFVNLSTARRLRAARGCSETRESMRTRTCRESLNQPVAPGAEVVEHVVDGAWRLHPSCRVELNGTRSANEPPASGAAGVDEFDRLEVPDTVWASLIRAPLIGHDHRNKKQNFPAGGQSPIFSIFRDTGRKTVLSAVSSSHSPPPGWLEARPPPRGRVIRAPPTSGTPRARPRRFLSDR